MSSLAPFLQDLLTDGEARLVELPALPPDDQAAAMQVLERAHRRAVLDLAGPPLPFDARKALATAELVWLACGFLVSRREPNAEVLRRLPRLGSPRTAKREAMPQLLAAGWLLESLPSLQSEVTADDLRALGQRLANVQFTGIMERYVDVAHKIRDLGIAFSDRRAVKALKLMAASALLCGRTEADLSDLWVLRYVWDRAEQIEPLAALVNHVLEQATADVPRHALARVTPEVDGEEVARQLTECRQALEAGGLSLTATARLRERITDLADRAAWVKDTKQRDHLLALARGCLERLG
jgi:hypothetical protein